LVKVAGVAAAIMVFTSPLLVRFLLAYGKFSLGEGSSAAARIEVWLQTIRLIIDYPLFGVGFNAYRYAMASYGVESIGGSSYAAEGGLLFVLALTGVVGLTLYLAMIWQIMSTCRGLWRDPQVPAGERGLAIGAAASTVGVIFSSIFTNVLLATFVMEILWVLWAVVSVARNSQRARNESLQGRATNRLVALVA
jgi:O-antigen ligase